MPCHNPNTGIPPGGPDTAKNGTGFAERMVGLKAGPSFSADGRHGRLSNAAYPFCTSPHHLLVWPPWGRALGTAEPGSATLCPVFLSFGVELPNPNPTNQPTWAELRAIDFCLLFPSTSASVSPTKHHQNPSYPSRLPPCCATVLAPRSRHHRLSLPPTRVARQLIPLRIARRTDQTDTGAEWATIRVRTTSSPLSRLPSHLQLAAAGCASSLDDTSSASTTTPPICTSHQCASMDYDECPQH